jgi:protein tyrosine phosphatase (PTP) superfamily phosphohydrolase (DUF442 family)
MRKAFGFAIAVGFVLMLFAPVLGWASGCPDDDSSRAEHLPARKLKYPGLPNFGEVTPTLYRGAQPTPQGFEQLRRMGISIVIDTRGGSREDERKLVAKLGMKYVQIPWHCVYPKDRVVVKFLSVIRDHPGNKIFVHCKTGDDRTGLMIAVWRMAYQGWTAKEALEEMHVYGFGFTHHFICPGLAAYEAAFPQHYRSSPAFARLRRKRTER